MTKEEAKQYTVGELVYVACTTHGSNVNTWHLAIVVSIGPDSYMAEEYSAVEVYDLKRGCNTSRVRASNLKKLV